MNEHVSFDPTAEVLEFSKELVPVFTQDRQDYEPLAAVPTFSENEDDFDDLEDFDDEDED